MRTLEAYGFRRSADKKSFDGLIPSSCFENFARKNIRSGNLLEDGQIVIRSSTHAARFVLMMGEPLNEPIVAYGPFLMNTQQEIVDAIQEFQSGKFGVLR